MMYEGIQTQPGVGGAPIVMWNEGGSGAIIGVHATGTGYRNYGTVFFDDKGLYNIFGEEELAEFLSKVTPYAPRENYLDYKY
jgi:hypothetical protein